MSCTNLSGSRVLWCQLDSFLIIAYQVDQVSHWVHSRYLECPRTVTFLLLLLASVERISSTTIFILLLVCFRKHDKWQSPKCHIFSRVLHSKLWYCIHSDENFLSVWSEWMSIFPRETLESLTIRRETEHKWISYSIGDKGIENRIDSALSDQLKLLQNINLKSRVMSLDKDYQVDVIHDAKLDLKYLNWQLYPNTFMVQLLKWFHMNEACMY